MELSVIIPTYNRKKVLRHLLLSLINQGKLEYEVIVFDDGGDDNTYLELEDIKDKFKLPYELKYFYQERKGFRAGSARNLGVSKACSNKFVFIDHDTLLAPFILQYFKEVSDGFFINGIKRLVSLQFYSTISDKDILEKMKFFTETTFGSLTATLSSFGSITRHDFKLVNGFDDDFTEYGLEDTELIDRLKDVKISSRTHPCCIGYHIEHDYEKRIVSRHMQDVYHHKRNNKTGDGRKVSIE